VHVTNTHTDCATKDAVSDMHINGQRPNSDVLWSSNYTESGKVGTFSMKGRKVSLRPFSAGSLNRVARSRSRGPTEISSQ
jgi:hypothetical protein